MATIDAKALVEESGLSQPAQYVILLAVDYRGLYSREDLIKELRIATGMGLRDACDAYREARASGLIVPEVIIINKDDISHEGGKVHPVHLNMR